jgi:transcription-repair coupling factor (superfamily II helicase)
MRRRVKCILNKLLHHNFPKPENAGVEWKKMKTPVDALIDSLQPLYSLKQILNLSVQQNKLYVSNFAGSSRSIFVKLITNDFGQIVILCPTVQSVNETKVELSLLDLEDELIVVDEFNIETLQGKLTDINTHKQFILISSYNLLKLKLPSKNSLNKSTTKVELGGNITYDDLIEYMNSINYDRNKFVENPGDFSVRGSIIDFWSFSEKQPCRLEFDGDFLESIRHFDPDTQRSLDKLTSTTVAVSLDDAENTSDIFDYLDNPLVITSEYELLNIFVNNMDSGRSFNIEDDIDDDLKEELYDEDPASLEARRSGQGHEHEEKVIDELENPYDLSLEKLFLKNACWILEDVIGQHDERIQLHLAEAPVINSNIELLYNLLKDYTNKNFQVVIAVENELQSKRLLDLLTDFKEELAGIIEAGKIKFIVFAIKSGFISKDDGLILLTDYQIFNKPYRTKLSSKIKFKKSRVKDFASIKRGDFVVHENFGIGQYAGLETIRIGDIEQESIKILYAEGGVVYVNLNYLSIVKKFSSKDNAQPRLSVLGGSEWKTTKKKVKAQIKEAARELITLYARRKAAQGFPFSADSIWQKELEASFFYEDTPDQMKVTEDVKHDMEGENPMDRLVCGDVGFGKTEIAVRAAFKAINDNKQVALLVPTTILAEQHYNTFKDRLTQFPVKVEALSRFKSKIEQTEITKRLTGGDVDVVIGTHRLLSKDIKFKDLGLLIIDEEHRFGVMAKEKLRSLKANVDTLTLTATPIPRTLNLSLLGARDLSIIATPPPNRQPIYTKVDTFDIHKIREWILSEVKRGGQIYFVHDRVQSIEKISAYVQKYVPEIKIGVAHGQMKPAELEKVIHNFLNKNYHMLISTKIIESGLDIPNVNTIIINRADRFGLAELHQLRGRVGRSDRQAYAYFLVPSLNTITKKAVKRLQAIEEYTELGEGFSLAMRDLEIRGAGNLLGTEQSGFIDSVGFDLYLKLLDEAVEELKQSEFKEVFKDLPKQAERSEPTVDTYFEIGIPQSFMPDQADRLSFYTALFSMLKIEELDEIKEEMIDRFGRLPLNVERLILAAVLRFYSSFALLERIIVQQNKVIIILPKAEREHFYQNKFVQLLAYISDHYSKEIKFVQSKDTLKLEMVNKFNSAESVMNFLIKFCKEIIEIIK